MNLLSAIFMILILLGSGVAADRINDVNFGWLIGVATGVVCFVLIGGR